MGDFSAALRGAAILRRYLHPGSWWDGNSVADYRLQGKYVLRIDEIQRGPTASVSDIEARANAAAIRAWASYVGLVVDVDTLIINDPEYDAYIAVWPSEWDNVMAMLQTL